MFRSGELPQMEQIINLHLDRVNVYPEYIEIHLNNVPTNVMKPSQRNNEPAISGLHTFSIEKMDEKNSVKRHTRKIEQYQGRIAVKLHIKVENENLSEKNGQKDTRAQDILDSSKSGGAEPLPILLAHTENTAELSGGSKLEEERGYTNIRKLPLCCMQNKEPLQQIWLIGKDTLQGPRNGR